MKTLDATKAAANLKSVLREVHALHESFTILHNGVPCAYLIPAVESRSDSHELANDLAAADLSAADRRSLAADLRKSRKTLKPLKNPLASASRWR